MITYDTDSVAMPAIDQARTTEWIRRVAEAHGRRTGTIAYMFTDDNHILAANRQFLGHDYYTDIITFDYTRGHQIAGDIIISLDTVRSNADLYARPYDEELHRVIIHGVLHLCGINDKGPGEREIMERHEDEALQMRIED